MARSALTYQQIDRDGVVPSYASANADGNSLANDGRMFLHVKNGSGSSINVTVETPGTVDGNAVADKVVAVAAGSEKMIGPYPPDVYNQSDGTMYIDYSAVTSVTVGVLRI